jgi:hypothetical protein
MPNDNDRALFETNTGFNWSVATSRDSRMHFRRAFAIHEGVRRQRRETKRIGCREVSEGALQFERSHWRKLLTPMAPRMIGVLVLVIFLERRYPMHYYRSITPHLNRIYLCSAK